MQWLQGYYFLFVGTLCDASKRIFFWSIVCNHCKNTVYCFLNVATLCDASRQIFFSIIVCSICKSMISFILWCIKTHFVLKFMNAVILQDYCCLSDGTLCDASKRFFWSNVCSDCKSTVFFMLGYFVMHQNQFSLEVTNPLIARIIFSSCWDILWCIKTYFLLKYCMQWLKEYCFPHVGTFSDESKRI